MRHVPTVAARELRSLFVSPVAYAVMSLFSVLTGLFFVLGVAAFNAQVMRMRQFQAMEQLAQINLNDHLIAYFLSTIATVLLFLVPGVTMGLFSSEKTNGTQELLFTSPLTIWDIVLGKFAAGALFVGLLVALVGAFPLLLFVYGDPEVGKTVTGLLGLLLVAWTYVSIGCFASAITRSQVVGFLITFVLLLFMLLLPFIADVGAVGDAPGLGGLLRWISTEEHFQPLLQGLVDTSDLAYFAVIVGSFLLLTKAAVESARWR